MGILNARMQQILQLLLSTDELQTSGEIATNLQLSSKTVQKEMKELNKLLSDKTAIIDSYRGKGYLLRIFDEEQFKHFLRKDTDKNDQVIPTEPEARMQFLMEKLLLQTSYLKIDDLADELFVSRSTLQSDINDIRKIVKKYHLSLEQKPNYGIKITGNEMDIRFCISEYVFNHKSDLSDQITELIEILPQNEIEWIRDSILTNLRKYSIVITDISLNNLITHIAIACKRIREREMVEIFQEELGEITKKKEYTVAKAIVEDIEQKLDVSFPKNEVVYLVVHLQGTKKMHSNSEMNEIENYLENDIQQLTKEILRRMDNVYSLNLFQDNELMLSLSLHLEPAINRYKHQMNLRNPLLEEIKNKYLFSYEAALTIAAEVIKESLGITIDENEIGYIALHFEAALERQKQNQKVRNDV
ncbi:transcription antiterminator [Tetragenococcus halophilus]|nr:transcription antiterminator [Tetragenococcus halophilus]